MLQAVCCSDELPLHLQPYSGIRTIKHVLLLHPSLQAEMCIGVLQQVRFRDFLQPLSFWLESPLVDCSNL